MTHFPTMRRLAPVLIVLLLAGCGSSETTTTKEKPRQAATKSSPSAKPPPSPKNPLATSTNKLACSSSRRAIAKLSPVLNDISTGSAVPADAVDPLRSAQRSFSDAGSYSTSTVQSILQSEAVALGRMRVALLTGSVSGLAAAVQQSNGYLNKLNPLCESIGA